MSLNWICKCGQTNSGYSNTCGRCERDKERQLVRVHSLIDIKRLAGQQKALVSNHNMLLRPKPAAFIINMSGHMIHALVSRGLYVYEKKSNVTTGDNANE